VCVCVCVCVEQQGAETTSFMICTAHQISSQWSSEWGGCAFVLGWHNWRKEIIRVTKA